MKTNKIKKDIDIRKKRVLEALEKTLGIVTTACKMANIKRASFYEYYNSDEEFRQRVDEIQEMAVDFVESRLFEKIKEGDTTAIIFYLKHKGRNRGYTEKEIDKKDINILIIDEKAEKIKEEIEKISKRNEI